MALVAVVLCPVRAHADDGFNALIGPLIGFRLGGHDGPRGVFGVEGGIGWGPERLNAGFEHRDGKLFTYVELDPWYVIGASLGLGVDSDGQVSPVIGVWEGVPLKLPDCDDTDESAVTLAAGYRYTGVHELYVTAKAGVSDSYCFD